MPLPLPLPMPLLVLSDLLGFGAGVGAADVDGATFSVAFGVGVAFCVGVVFWVGVVFGVGVALVWTAGAFAGGPLDAVPANVVTAGASDPVAATVRLTVPGFAALFRVPDGRSDGLTGLGCVGGTTPEGTVRACVVIVACWLGVALAAARFGAATP
ncbi:MAG: hypothetical protein QOH29_1181, partial [Actinomycetota bacterium]|nr:hypothetical protein [Actinomycetota bacterium]